MCPFLLWVLCGWSAWAFCCWYWRLTPLSGFDISYWLLFPHFGFLGPFAWIIPLVERRTEEA